jgi:hypothetical protein
LLQAVDFDSNDVAGALLYNMVKYYGGKYNKKLINNG